MQSPEASQPGTCVSCEGRTLAAGQVEEDGVTHEDNRALKDHIVRLYCERYSCRQIADLTGQTYWYVRNALKGRGITPINRASRSSRAKTALKR